MCNCWCVFCFCLLLSFSFRVYSLLSSTYVQRYYSISDTLEQPVCIQYSRAHLSCQPANNHTHTNNVLLLGAVPYSPLLSVTLFSNRYRVFGRTHTHRDTLHVDEKKCLVCLHFYFIIDYVFAEHVLVWLWRASIRKNEHPYICMRTYLWIRISAVTRRTDRENDKSSLRCGTDCAQ